MSAMSESEVSRRPRRPQGPILHILLTLGSDQLHGYAIMQRFAAETGEVLLPGTLYSSIARMLDNGWLEEVETHEPGGDARRRYYRVTELGREIARSEAERLERLVELARRQDLLGDVSA